MIHAAVYEDRPLARRHEGGQAVKPLVSPMVSPSKPIHVCPNCGAHYSGGTHICRGPQR